MRKADKENVEIEERPVEEGETYRQKIEKEMGKLGWVGEFNFGLA